jgi:hypothetical protein
MGNGLPDRPMGDSQMSTNWIDRAASATRAVLALTGLMLPMASVPADAPVSRTQAEKLEWLLATHDVRYVMQAPRGRVSDCIR